MVDVISLVVAAAALTIAVYSWLAASRSPRNDVLAQVRDWAVMLWIYLRKLAAYASRTRIALILRN
jgi:hypothetical protein